jgi:hypothetical protein
MTQNIISEAKSEAIIQFNFDVDQKEIVYADDIRNAFITRFFSVYNDGWSERKPISRLITSTSFRKLKVIVSNDSDYEVRGVGTLTGVVEVDKELGYRPEIDDKAYLGVNVSMDGYIDIGNNLSKLERDQNYFLNKRSIIEVLYRHTKPNLDSTDMVLGEYSLLNLSKETCCKIITENNELPKMESAEMNEWGMQFASFKAYFSIIYFESVFGKGAVPREGDFLTFNQLKRSFNVSSVSQLEGINGCIYAYELSLKNYDENSNIAGINDKITGDNNMEDAYFQMYEEEETQMKNDVNNSSFIFDDHTRYSVQDVDILKDTVHGNYYKFKHTKPASSESVIYDSKFTLDGGFCLSFMVNNDTNTNQNIWRLGDMTISIMQDGSIEIDKISEIKISSVKVTPKVWSNVVLNFFADVIEISIIEQESKSVLSEQIAVTKKYVFQDTPLVMMHNDVMTTKIRLWKKTIPREYFNRIILSKYVEKASITHIIDDVQEILNIPVIKRSKIKDRNSEKYIYTQGVKTGGDTVKMAQIGSETYYNW